MDTYILLTASGRWSHSLPQGNKCAVGAIMNGWREGSEGWFHYINDMYNNDVGKGVVYAYEAYEAKERVAAFRAPVCFINL